METLQEVKTWMKEKNINNIYIPNNKNNRYVTDIGEGLEEIYGLSIWYNTDEKGNRTDIDYFNSEKDAVIFVFNQINNQK